MHLVRYYKTTAISSSQVHHDIGNRNAAQFFLSCWPPLVQYFDFVVFSQCEACRDIVLGVDRELDGCQLRGAPLVHTVAMFL